MKPDTNSELPRIAFGYGASCRFDDLLDEDDGFLVVHFFLDMMLYRLVESEETDLCHRLGSIVFAPFCLPGKQWEQSLPHSFLYGLTTNVEGSDRFVDCVCNSLEKSIIFPC